MSTVYGLLCYTVKPILSCHLKIDDTKVLKENGNLMVVENIAECSPWSILQYFWPALSDNRYWKPIFMFFLSAAYDRFYYNNSTPQTNKHPPPSPL